jgi:hypothetical protein
MRRTACIASDTVVPFIAARRAESSKAAATAETIVDGGFDFATFVEAHLAKHVAERQRVTVSAI